MVVFNLTLNVAQNKQSQQLHSRESGNPDRKIKPAAVSIRSSRSVSKKMKPQSGTGRVSYLFILLERSKPMG